MLSTTVGAFARPALLMERMRRMHDSVRRSYAGARKPRAYIAAALRVLLGRTRYLALRYGASVTSRSAFDETCPRSGRSTGVFDRRVRQAWDKAAGRPSATERMGTLPSRMLPGGRSGSRDLHTAVWPMRHVGGPSRPLIALVSEANGILRNQTRSQRRRVSGDAGRPPATLTSVNWHDRRR